MAKLRAVHLPNTHFTPAQNSFHFSCGDFGVEGRLVDSILYLVNRETKVLVQDFKKSQTTEELFHGVIVYLLLYLSPFS
jgi:hypothetical protein